MTLRARSRRAVGAVRPPVRMLPSCLGRRTFDLRPSSRWSFARLPRVVSSEASVSVLGTCYDTEVRGERLEVRSSLGLPVDLEKLANTSPGCEASIGTRLRVWEWPIGLTEAMYARRYTAST